MLTLVAAVLAYDMAREMCEVRDARSSMVETEASPRVARRRGAPSRSDRSCTRLEKDMLATGLRRRWSRGGCEVGGSERGDGGGRLGFVSWSWGGGGLAGRDDGSILRRTQG